MTIHSFLSKVYFYKIGVLLFFIVYLFFLIINLPANIALSLIHLPRNISLSSVSGTFWSGYIKSVRYSGVEIGSASWELHPLYLIVGELSADVSVVNNEHYINSQLNISPSGRIQLEETRFLFDLSLLQPLTYGMPFSYAGKVSGYFPVSFINKNDYVGINGKLSIDNIEMISPQRQPFDGIMIDFRAEKEGATSGKIKDNDGQLDIDGQLTINKHGQLNISAKLATREAGSSLENVISFLGRKDSRGRVQLTGKFNLWH